MLSARRVVPLEKINAKSRHRRQWFLGGAFAVAMMLGAASALVASYLKMRNVQNVPAEVTQVDVPEASVAVVENPPAETPLATVEETAELIPEESEPKKAPVKRKTVVAAVKPDDYEPSHSRRMSEEDALHQIRDTVLFDEWQERRARRVLRRERRRAGSRGRRSGPWGLGDRTAGSFHPHQVMLAADDVGDALSTHRQRRSVVHVRRADRHPFIPDRRP